MKHVASETTLSELTLVAEKDVQPNAVDLKLDRVWKLDNESPFLIDEDQKKHRQRIEVTPNQDGYFYLYPNTSYEICFENTISVGEGEAGFVITRSTLNRNGVFITSGLYDSGYSGPMAACLHNLGGPTMIKKGTRIGQYIMWSAETLHLYDGDYGKGGIDGYLSADRKSTVN